MRPATWVGTIPLARRTFAKERLSSSVAPRPRVARAAPSSRPISREFGPGVVNRLSQSPEPSRRRRRLTTAARRARHALPEIRTTELKSRVTICAPRRARTARENAERPSAR
jgi:hypothetical protein